MALQTCFNFLVGCGGGGGGASAAGAGEPFLDGAADSLATLAMQVRNPLAAITAASNSDGIADNNGTVLSLPSVPSAGAITASGYLILESTRAQTIPPRAALRLSPPTVRDCL